MPTVRKQSNTTKSYPCTVCGNFGNIIREDASNPRLRCNECGFLYDGKDSLELVKRGEVPQGPPKLDDPTPEPTVVEPTPMVGELKVSKVEGKRLPMVVPLPRKPSHVILSKDRKEFDFATEKTFKKKVLEWEAGNKNYDVFLLVDCVYTVSVDVKP